MLDTLKAKLKNPAVLTATLGNLISIAAIVGVNAADLDKVERVGALLIQIAIQWGIMTNAGN